MSQNIKICVIFKVLPKVAESVSWKDPRRVPVVPEQGQGGAEVGEQEVEREPVVVAQGPVHLTEVKYLKKVHMSSKQRFGMFLFPLNTLVFLRTLWIIFVMNFYNLVQISKILQIQKYYYNYRKIKLIFFCYQSFETLKRVLD